MAGISKADRLRKARLAAGFRSASEAARSLGVSTATYIHHENGTRDFGEGPAAIYARRYHVTQSWLLLGDGEMRDEALLAVKEAEDAELEEEKRQYREHREAMTPAERQKRRDDLAQRENDETLRIARDMTFVPEILASYTRAPSNLSTNKGWQRFVDLDDPVYHPVAATWGIPTNHLQYEFGSPPGNTVLFPIIGNANAPALVHGDLAIVNVGTDDVIADGFYLVADKVANPQVRHLQINLFTDPTTVTLYAAASPDAKLVLELGAISIVGMVVGKISRVLGSQD